MVFVQFRAWDYLGYLSTRYIKLRDIESIGINAKGTEIRLKSGFEFVTPMPIDEVVQLVENALAKEESLI